MVLALTSPFGDVGGSLELTSPNGYVLRALLQEVVAAPIAPGVNGDSLQTWNNGTANVVRWLNGTGDTGVSLYNYLQRTSNVADAIGLALTENPTTPALICPGRTLPLTRRVGDFLGGDGLRGNLAIIGVPGVTKFTRSGGANFTPMFAFPQDTSNVLLYGVGAEIDNPNFSSLSFQAYNTSNWIVDKCYFGCTTPGFGGGAALGLFGTNNARVTNSRFLRSQAGFAGLGYGARNAIFALNVGDSVSDFLASAVCGPPLVTHLDIDNVSFVNNEIRGLSQSGGFFAGSDGGATPANLTRRIRITGNQIGGNIEGPVLTGPRLLITFVAGLQGEDIKIEGNQLEIDNVPVGDAAYGIFVSGPPGMTRFQDLSVKANRVGALGENGGVQGVYIDAPFVEGLELCGNKLRDNRGMLVTNPINRSLIQSNEVFNAQATALAIRASGQNIAGLRIFDNFLESTVLFENALRLQGLTPGQTIAARIYRNTLRATLGNGPNYIPNGGSGSFRFVDNELVLGSGGASTDFVNAVVFARDNENYP